MPDGLFYFRIKQTLVVETVRYLAVIAQQDTVGCDDFRIVLSHHIADTAAKGCAFPYLANHVFLLSTILYSFMITFNFSSNSITTFFVR